MPRVRNAGRLLDVTFAVSAVVPLSAVASAQVSYRVVAASGQHVPGFAPGVVFSSFYFPPTINNSNRVAFIATMTGPGITAETERGVWAETSSGLRLAARKGDVPPGVRNARTYQDFSIPVLNDMGALAMDVNLSVPGHGVWTGGVGGVTPVAQTDDSAPGGGTGAVFGRTPGDGTWLLPVMSPGGSIAFGAWIRGPSLTVPISGLWKKSVFTDLTLVAKEYQAAPGTPPGIVFVRGPIAGDNSAFGNVLINGTGTICFSALARNPSIPTTSATGGIWRDGPFGLQLVAYQGDPASGPGLGGATYAALGFASLNDAGRVVFGARVAGVGVTTANDTVVMSDRSGVLMQAVVREGESSPIPGVAFGNLASPLINREGRLVFACLLTGAGVDAGNNSAICSDGTGVWRLIARKGQGAPGTTASFADAGTFDSAYSINAGGQVLLKAALTGPGVTSANDVGIWATDSRGDLRLIAREGDMLDVNPEPTVSDLRTIAAIWSYRPLSSGGEDGLPKSLSDDGRVAFQATFTDQTSAVFIATIPAPAPCPADLDDGSGTGQPDGGVTIDDLLYYLDQYAQGNTRADLDDGSGTGTPDSGVTIDDLLYFLVRYEAGC